MMNREQLLVGLALVTLLVVCFIALVLVARHGRSADTARILAEMENLRAQNSAEHGAHEQMLRDTRTHTSWLRQQWDKFRAWPDVPKVEKPK